MSIRLGLKEQKRKELYAKQGRGSQFTSRDQRDMWIQNELKSLSKAIKEKNEQIERLQEDLKVRVSSVSLSLSQVYCLLICESKIYGQSIYILLNLSNLIWFIMFLS